MKWFKLFPSVKTTRGFKRSLIFDTYTGRYSTIPGSVIEMLELLQQKSYEDILEEYSMQKTIVEEYYQFLVTNGYGFFDNTPISNFHSIQGEIEEPFQFTTFILDYGDSSKFSLIEAVDKACSVAIKTFQIRCFNEVSMDLLERCIDRICHSGVKSLEIVVRYSLLTSDQAWIELFNKSGKLISLTIHTAPEHRVLDDDGLLVKTTQVISSESDCGKISEKYFVVNNYAYLNSRACNSCLNKKLSFSKDGRVRNCPY
jgi:hypothetical protein